MTGRRQGKAMLKLAFTKAVTLVLLSSLLLPGEALARNPHDPFCLFLRGFVASVKKDETRSIEFHTTWGGGFKGSGKNVIFEKRCLDNGFAPAKAVCDYLMEHGQIEFAGNNALRAIECLSSDTHFGDLLQLSRIETEFSYGTAQRGSNVTVQFVQDSELGGMVLNITADGY